MSAYIVDLNGTLFKFGTNDFLPGAKDFLDFIKDNGHQLILTTRRGEDWDYHNVFSKAKTLQALKRLGIEYHSIVFEVESPRIVINDDGCSAINVVINDGIRKEDYMEKVDK